MLHSREKKYCAKCDYFSIADEAEADQGRGLCTLHNRVEEWMARFCVNFGKAKNISARQVWIMQQVQKLKEKQDGREQQTPA